MFYSNHWYFQEGNFGISMHRSFYLVVIWDFFCVRICKMYLTIQIIVFRTLCMGMIFQNCSCQHKIPKYFPPPTHKYSTLTALSARWWGNLTHSLNSFFQMGDILFLFWEMVFFFAMRQRVLKLTYTVWLKSDPRCSRLICCYNDPRCNTQCNINQEYSDR